MRPYHPPLRNPSGEAVTTNIFPRAQLRGRRYRKIGAESTADTTGAQPWSSRTHSGHPRLPRPFRRGPFFQPPGFPRKVAHADRLAPLYPPRPPTTLRTPPVSSYGLFFSNELNSSVPRTTKDALQTSSFNDRLKAREEEKEQLRKGQLKNRTTIPIRCICDK